MLDWAAARAERDLLVAVCTVFFIAVRATVVCVARGVAAVRDMVED